MLIPNTRSSGNSSEANCATESPAETRDYFSAYPDFIDCELELHAHVYGTVANEAHSGIKFDQTVQTPFFNPVAEHTTENLFESKNQTGVPSDYLCAPKVGFQSSSSSERASPCMVVDPTNYVTMNLPNAKDPISMKPKPSAEPAAAAIHGQATVFNTATGLSFKSAEEANAFAPQKWAEPLKDPTIPQTQQDQEAIVMELMQAMYSIEQSKDNEGMVRPWKQGRHSQIRVEIACWNILVRNQASFRLTLF